MCSTNPKRGESPRWQSLVFLSGCRDIRRGKGKVLSTTVDVRKVRARNSLRRRAPGRTRSRFVTEKLRLSLKKKIPWKEDLQGIFFNLPKLLYIIFFFFFLKDAQNSSYMQISLSMCTNSLWRHLSRGQRRG